MEKDKITYLTMYQNKYREYDRMLDAIKLASKQELKGVFVRVYIRTFNKSSSIDFMRCVYYTNMEVR